MQTLWAVIKELAYFVIVERFGFAPQQPLAIPTKTPLIALPNPTPTPLLGETESALPTVENVEETPLQPASRGTAAIPPDTTFVYVTIPYTPLRMFPTYAVDDVLRELPYATRLHYIKRQGKWLCVQYEEQTGWIEIDMVCVKETDVIPDLLSGEQYPSHHSETIKLRTWITDEFHTVMAELPLQDIEYVEYRLRQAGHTVLWPAVRPRIAGTWQRHLKGIQGVHIGIHPKTDTVLEYIDENDLGHIAYVDAVYPDQSIALSMIEAESDGKFLIGTFTESHWREWRPVFIDIQ